MLFVREMIFDLLLAAVERLVEQNLKAHFDLADVVGVFEAAGQVGGLNCFHDVDFLF